MSPEFSPVDVGAVGRRAVAWFYPDGLVVAATDDDAAKHAIDVVLTVLCRVGREPDARRFYAWTFELLADVALAPEDGHSLHTFSRGDCSDRSVYERVGYGYVKPAAVGHECGGALFDQARRAVLYFAPHTVWLVSGPPQ